MIVCVQTLAEILDSSASVATLRRGNFFVSKMIRIIYISSNSV